MVVALQARKYGACRQIPLENAEFIGLWLGDGATKGLRGISLRVMSVHGLLLGVSLVIFADGVSTRSDTATNTDHRVNSKLSASNGAFTNPEGNEATKSLTLSSNPLGSSLCAMSFLILFSFFNADQSQGWKSTGYND